MIDVPTLAELDLEYALPVIWLGGFTTILLIADLFIPRKIVTAWLTMGALVIAFILNLAVYNDSSSSLFGLYVADQFSGFLNIVILVTAFITVMLSVDYLKRTGMERGEYYSLLLFSTIGMMLMGSANDLIVIFIALELLSIPLYILSAFRPNDTKSEESGLKYFILGAFASAFLVYGAALIYGATGTTRLPEIVNALPDLVGASTGPVLYLLVGTALVIVGLGFKVAAVPFHMWTPDVYEGAPTPITAFMSVGAKAGGFAALLRVAIVALPTFFLQESDSAAAWQTTIWIVSAATMIVGNFIAISQTNIKRMLAYSSIAHAGYLLMAVAAAGSPEVANAAAQAALVYLMAYAFTNMGAFGIAMAIEKDDGSGTDLEDFVGLGQSRPLMAAAMAVFMLSLIGIPLTGGFVGKWLIFRTAMQADLVPLAIIGVLTSVVSAFYYVRIVVNMYLVEGDGDPAEGATPYVVYAVYASFAAVVLLGIVPAVATNLTDTIVLATSSLIP